MISNEFEFEEKFLTNQKANTVYHITGKRCQIRLDHPMDNRLKLLGIAWDRLGSAGIGWNRLRSPGIS